MRSVGKPWCPEMLNRCWFGWLGGGTAAVQCHAECGGQGPCPVGAPGFCPQSGGERLKLSQQFWGSSWVCVTLRL